jgi:hypothetical protein
MIILEYCIANYKQSEKWKCYSEVLINVINEGENMWDCLQGIWTWLNNLVKAADSDNNMVNSEKHTIVYSMGMVQIYK